MNQIVRIGVARSPQHTAERRVLSVRRQAKFHPEAAARALLTFFFLLLCTHCSLLTTWASPWRRQPSGTMAWLRAVYFLDPSRGWVAGSNGALLATTDGGATWNKLSPLTKDTLQDVYFADGDVGWLIVTRDIFKLKTNEPASYLLKTENGGMNWRPVFLSSADMSARLVRLVFADAEHGWAFGESGVVFGTRDGGAHWTRQTAATRHLLLGGAFADGAHGCLVGAAGTIVYTSDGGVSWQSSIVRDGARVRFNAATFVGSRGWAVGGAGQIFSTNDGGRTWFRETSPTDTDLLDIDFIDSSEGWVVGAGGVMLHTRDGGIHWSVEPTETSHVLQRLFIVDRSHAWAVGFGGTILKFGESKTPQLRNP
ncbi:MAG: WD40/YVTN/BNR-like repeat-containing protein [Pyrinomonadaceae bacterium]